MWLHQSCPRGEQAKELSHQIRDVVNTRLGEEIQGVHQLRIDDYRVCDFVRPSHKLSPELC